MRGKRAKKKMKKVITLPEIEWKSFREIISAVKSSCRAQRACFLDYNHFFSTFLWCLQISCLRHSCSLFSVKGNKCSQISPTSWLRGDISTQIIHRNTFAPTHHVTFFAASDSRVVCAWTMFFSPKTRFIPVLRETLCAFTTLTDWCEVGRWKSCCLFSFAQHYRTSIKSFDLREIVFLFTSHLKFAFDKHK